LLDNFLKAAGNNIPCTSDIERFIEQQPQILRTLPGFYPIQVSSGCPQKCSYCPYPAVYDQKTKNEFMDIADFEKLLDKITAFSKDAVIDLSLWGELSLHPEKMKLIEAVISRKELSLIIETSGIGWKQAEFEKCAELNKTAEKRKNLPAPLSWIVSLDTTDPQKYMELRGSGFAEANDCVKKLLSLFPQDCYVQAVRISGNEDDTEKFYRFWKENSPHGEKNIIIQKYDDFCGFLEKKQASDISPVIRKPCWHIMRDMPVLVNGNVPLCREELDSSYWKNNNSKPDRYLGNVFTDSLENIWLKSERYYLEHCRKNYEGICLDCDEYYTYNF
jgi:spiro-SPASM protein